MDDTNEVRHPKSQSRLRMSELIPLKTLKKVKLNRLDSCLYFGNNCRMDQESIESAFPNLFVKWLYSWRGICSVLGGISGVLITVVAWWKEILEILFF